MPTITQAAAVGQLNQSVTIQTATTADDGMGGTTVTWPAQAWRYTKARVLPLDMADREHIQAAQVSALQSYRVVLRYRPTLTVKDRIVWRGKTLQIHTVIDDGAAKHRTVCGCTEIQ